MSEARRHPEIARISAGFDADVKRWLIDLFKAGAERGDISRDVDFDGAATMLMIIADGVWWRRALDPQFQAGNSVADLHGHRASHAARAASDAARRGEHQNESKTPHRHRPGRGRRAVDRVRPFPAARDAGKPRRHPAAEPPRRQLFRVAVLDSQLVQHHRKLLLSGRTEADKKVTLMARTGGVLTELRVRRGSRVEKGDVIAILSDEAREAQVMQAKALVEQRKIELDAKRRLIELNAVPRLELSSLEAQHKAADGRARRRRRRSAIAASSPRRGPASSPS